MGANASARAELPDDAFGGCAEMSLVVSVGRTATNQADSNAVDLGTKTAQRYTFVLSGYKMVLSSMDFCSRWLYVEKSSICEIPLHVLIPNSRDHQSRGIP